MTQEPFRKGEFLRYIGHGGSTHFHHDQLYTCSGCTVFGPTNFAVGAEEVLDGTIVWVSNIWELAMPRTIADDIETYQTEDYD